MEFFILSLFGSVFVFSLLRLLHSIESRNLKEFKNSNQKPKYRKQRSYDSEYYSHYVQVPRHKEYQWMYKQGNKYHHREGYLSQNDHTFKAKIEWRDAYAGHGEMLFDYNHGYDNKEKEYQNDYQNLKVKRSKKKSKHKAVFGSPIKLPLQDYSNGHKYYKADKTTNKPQKIVTFKPALLEYPRFINKPKVIPTPVSYHRPTAAYLTVTFPSQPPKVTNNFVSIYNLPHGYFYRVF